MSFHLMQLISIGTQLIYGLLEIGLIAAMIKNLTLSRWMQVALIGVLMTLSIRLLGFVLPVMMVSTAGTGGVYRLWILRTGLDLVALGIFVAGMSATLFDVRRQLRVATAMLDNSPNVNEPR